MEALEQQQHEQNTEPRGAAGWSEFFARWRSGGLALSQYCRGRGISYDKARYWKKRLGLVKHKEPRAGAGCKPAPPVPGPLPGEFAKVMMETANLGDGGDGTLTIELPSGARVRAGGGADLQALRLALEVLSR